MLDFFSENTVDLLNGMQIPSYYKDKSIEYRYWFRSLIHKIDSSIILRAFLKAGAMTFSCSVMGSWICPYLREIGRICRYMVKMGLCLIPVMCPDLISLSAHSGNCSKSSLPTKFSYTFDLRRIPRPFKAHA